MITSSRGEIRHCNSQNLGENQEILRTTQISSMCALVEVVTAAGPFARGLVTRVLGWSHCTDKTIRIPEVGGGVMEITGSISIYKPVTIYNPRVNQQPHNTWPCMDGWIQSEVNNPLSTHDLPAVRGGGTSQEKLRSCSLPRFALLASVAPRRATVQTGTLKPSRGA